MTDEVVYEEPGTALARVEAAPVTLFRTDDPVEVVARATATANALMDAVKAHDAKTTDKTKKLIAVISGREFPKVECWTLLGTMVGVFPVCEWTRKIEGGWEARVTAQTLSGLVVGAAEAQCLNTEPNWKSRDDYALRSMAQTRATSKALSIPLRFVMILAGLEGTPAEEMPRDPQRDDPHGLESSRADAPYDADDPASVRVHFGTNAEKRVGDLTQRQRGWYAGDGWAEKKAESGREVTEQDRRLRRAARILTGLPAFEQDGPFGDVAF